MPRPRVRGDLENVKPSLLLKLEKLARYYGKGYQVVVSSGHRSYVEQVTLYNHYKKYGWPIAAKPGKSNHNRNPATAVDAYIIGPGGKRVPYRRLKLWRAGLKQPVKGEAWHLEER